MPTALRPPLTTVEAIQAIALREPRRLALLEEDTACDYGTLFAAIVHCARALQRLGVRRGQRVAVAGPGFALQLVALLACESLGAATVSFAAADDPDAQALLARVDFALAPQPLPCPPGVGFQLLDAQFVRSLMQPLPPGADAGVALALDEPLRLVRTSGSTGQSKFMVLSRGAQEYWIRSGGDAARYDAGTRLLIGATLVLNVAFTRSCACLRLGAAVLCGHGARIAALAPTQVWAGLPLHLQRLLDELPAGYVAPQPVAVGTGGGTLTPELRQRAAQVFGGPVVNRYGSNEAGLICDELDASGTGVLSPGVELRILGPAGEELPAGRIGLVAVRTPALVPGYLDAPEASAAAFRDGWFLSGDIGRLVGPRRLRLLGRHDDLINLAGIKMPAAEVEAGLRALPAVADCAVVVVNLDGGAVTLGVALVLVPGAGLQEALVQMRSPLGHLPGTTVRVRVLAELPRMPTGKTDRMALQWLFQEEASQP